MSDEMNLDDVIEFVCEDLGLKYGGKHSRGFTRTIESEHGLIYLNIFKTSLDITSFSMKIPGSNVKTRKMDISPSWHVDIHDPTSLENVSDAIKSIVKFSKEQQQELIV